MEQKIEILYIDDELNNLVSFKATFRYLYTIHLANNIQQAEEILKSNNNIQIIFCDQRMPDELGIDFLARINKLYPYPIRILLTAYADMETVIDAINRGNIFKFVRKPWIEEEIISSIEEASKLYLASSLLTIQNQELEKAYNELDKFAYSISHDLRDPLTGVMSAIDYALEYEEVNPIHQLLNLMKGSVKKLDEYMDSLRDYYLLRRGELLIEEINFENFFYDISEFYKMSIKKNNVDLQLKLDLNGVFKNDKSLLELIIHNLLSNSFKYQRKEETKKIIRVNIFVSKSILTLTVEDNGIGIPYDAIDNIFRLFFRANNQAQGMGFGLYNVKNALAKMNGTIKVQSEEGEYSKFILSIPSK